MTRKMILTNSMGTRGYIIIKYHNRIYYIYNQWDSYPDGLGNLVHEWIISQLEIGNGSMDHIREMLNKYQFFSCDNLNADAAEKKLSNTNSKEKPPSGVIKQFIANRKLFADRFNKINGKIDCDDIDYRPSGDGKVTDGLSIFIEYSYLIDLDNNRFKMSGWDMEKTSSFETLRS